MYIIRQAEGKTSDAEFLIDNSLYPLPEEPYFLRIPIMITTVYRKLLEKKDIILLFFIRMIKRFGTD